MSSRLKLFFPEREREKKLMAWWRFCGHDKLLLNGSPRNRWKALKRKLSSFSSAETRKQQSKQKPFVEHKFNHKKNFTISFEHCTASTME